ncbi:unnamed protein product [Amoebophrya sp. A25]|nr:unnamed protein product [Amoebophrya sp. A25]|eukprot:GSA25T00016229001.1
MLPVIYVYVAAIACCFARSAKDGGDVENADKGSPSARGFLAKDAVTAELEISPAAAEGRPPLDDVTGTIVEFGGEPGDDVPVALGATTVTKEGPAPSGQAEETGEKEQPQQPSSSEEKADAAAAILSIAAPAVAAEESKSTATPVKEESSKEEPGKTAEEPAADKTAGEPGATASTSRETTSSGGGASPNKKVSEMMKKFGGTGGSSPAAKATPKESGVSTAKKWPKPGQPKDATSATVSESAPTGTGTTPQAAAADVEMLPEKEEGSPSATQENKDTEPTAAVSFVEGGQGTGGAMDVDSSTAPVEHEETSGAPGEECAAPVSNTAEGALLSANVNSQLATDIQEKMTLEDKETNALTASRASSLVDTSVLKPDLDTEEGEGDESKGATSPTFLGQNIGDDAMLAAEPKDTAAPATAAAADQSPKTQEESKLVVDLLSDDINMEGQLPAAAPTSSSSGGGAVAAMEAGDGGSAAGAVTAHTGDDETQRSIVGNRIRFFEQIVRSKGKDSVTGRAAKEVKSSKDTAEKEPSA